MRERNIRDERMMCRLVQQRCKNFKAVRQEGAKNKQLKDGVPVTGVPDCVARSVILYLITKNRTTVEIYREMCETFGQGVITEAECFSYFPTDSTSCFIFRCQVKDYHERTTQSGIPVTGTPSFNCSFFAFSCCVALKFL